MGKRYRQVAQKAKDAEKNFDDMVTNMRHMAPQQGKNTAM